MQLHTVTHVDQLAVCNDGSPGAYYHRNGAVDNSTRYATREQVIWRAVPSQGGLHCTCDPADREPETQSKSTSFLEQEVTESSLVQKEATGDVTGHRSLQVGDPLPGRRLVLGQPIVRSAQRQHSLPHVHISAACPNLCPHLSSWAAGCCAAGALPIASSTACCQASQSEAWWIGHALPCIEGDHCGLGEGSTKW